MPIDYQYDPVSEVIVVTAIGIVTFDDRVEFVRAILNDPLMPAPAPMLIDASEVTNAPNIDDVRRIAFLLQLLNRRFQRRIAYWVTTVGLSTSFTIVSLTANQVDENFRTFAYRDHALQWLRDY